MTGQLCSEVRIHFVQKATIFGSAVPANMIHYGMTKASLSAIANGISKLTKGTEVTVNTILGGPTYSDGVSQVFEQIAKVQNLDPEKMKNIIIQQSNPHILLQRFIDPTEIVNLATYLSSPLSIATNAATLRADAEVLKTIPIFVCSYSKKTYFAAALGFASNVMHRNRESNKVDSAFDYLKNGDQYADEILHKVIHSLTRNK